MTAFATQKNIQTTGADIVPIGANGAGRSKLLSAAELRAAADVYSQAQADAAFVSLAGSYDNPTWITGLAVEKISGLGTLATQNGTFSGTSSGTNTGDQDLSSYLTSSGAAANYLPLAGGTLTGPITGTSDSIEQRRGLNTQSYNLFETYTSSTNFGALRLEANAAGYRIGAATGLSGTPRGLSLGGYPAGVWSEWLAFTTAGAASMAGGFSIVASGSNRRVILTNVSGTGRLMTNQIWLTNAGTDVGSAGSHAILSASGTVFVVSNDITFSPASSRTLATNGQFTVEMTSNTAGNLVYRGSDGTTRRMALTFS